MEHIPFEGGTTNNRSSSYRPSYYGRGSAVYGQHQSIYDASINFGDGIDLGDSGNDHNSNINTTTTTSSRASMMMKASTAANNKSLVDIFFEDDDDNNHDNSNNLDEFHPGGLPQKQQKGKRIKRCLLYLCLVIVFVVIFITVPKPGFSMMGENKEEKEEAGKKPDHDNNNESDLTTTTTPPVDSESSNQELIHEESGPITTIKPPPEDTTTTNNNNKEGEDEEEGEEVIPEQEAQVSGVGVGGDMMNRPDAILAFLLEKNISNPDDFDIDNTPASLAMQWMASMDSAELDVPGYAHNKHNVGTKEEQEIYFLQRYALACLYFSQMSRYSKDNYRARRKRRNLRERKQQQQQQEDSKGNNNNNKPKVVDEIDNRLEFDDHWTVKDDVCDWYGVECNNDKHVTALDLKHTKLSGFLVPEIFQEAALPQLTSLDFSFNYIKGDIPLSSSSSHNNNNVVNTKLEVLLLEHNHISGSTAGSLDRITKKLPGLVDLNLESNMIFGTIPEDWSLLSNLEVLKLANNKLNGPLPSGLGSLSKLGLLSLQGNKFSGNVPTTLGKMTSLVDLHLESNDLVGTMPVEVCALMAGDDDTGGLKGLSADCKDPKIECSCCSECF